MTLSACPECQCTIEPGPLSVIDADAQIWHLSCCEHVLSVLSAPAAGPGCAMCSARLLRRYPDGNEVRDYWDRSWCIQCVQRVVAEVRRKRELAAWLLMLLRLGLNGN